MLFERRQSTVRRMVCRASRGCGMLWSWRVVESADGGGRNDAHVLERAVQQDITLVVGLRVRENLHDQGVSPIPRPFQDIKPI